MPKTLVELIEMARKTPMTSEQEAEQRRSFAYGNTRIENDAVTREIVDRAADQMLVDGKKN